MLQVGRGLQIDVWYHSELQLVGTGVAGYALVVDLTNFIRKSSANVGSATGEAENCAARSVPGVEVVVGIQHVGVPCCGSVHACHACQLLLGPAEVLPCSDI